MTLTQPAPRRRRLLSSAALLAWCAIVGLGWWNKPMTPIRTVQLMDGWLFGTYTSDGNVVLATYAYWGQASGPIRIWNPRSGTVVRELLSKEDWIVNYPNHTDHALVVHGLRDVSLIDLSDASIRWTRTFSVLTPPVVSRDGSLIAIAWETRVTVVAAETGETVWESEGFQKPVEPAFVGRNWLRIRTADGILTILNTEDWTRRLPDLPYQVDEVSDDGRYVTFSGALDFSRRGVLDVETKDILLQAEGVRLVAGGAEAIAVGRDQGGERLLRWRISDGRQLLGTPPQVSELPIRNLHRFIVSPDERLLVVPSESTSTLTTGPIASFLVDQGLFLPQHFPGSHAPARVLDTNTGQVLGVIPHRLVANETNQNVRYQATNSTIIAYGPDHVLRVFRPPNGRNIWLLLGWALLPPAAVFALCWQIRRWRTRKHRRVPSSATDGAPPG
ncbi:MAG: WD40 repeat domain-containing protein [Planctomyces sp.]|nr:WD40 repeat domain-containing protein [Planctomyces sp.]